MKKIITAILLISTCSIIKSFGQAQANESQVIASSNELYNEILKVDSALFDAFNHCDSVAYKKFFTDDLEFYHDEGGLHDLKVEMQSIREMCSRNSHIRRELLKNTLEVHKIGNYGAVEIGVHRIFHTNKGESEHISGDYKFIHIWKKKDGFWKIARIISYGHKNMNNN